MKRFGLATIPWFVAAMFLSGCVASPEETESPVGTARSALINMNSLDPRALSADPAYPGGLTPGMLAQGALDVSAFSAAELSAIHDSGDAGKVSRQLLAYTVGCALDGTQSLSITWTDSQGDHPETYSGLFGLATGWSAGVPDEEHQRWVSACLASRVNYLGVAVPLSARATGISTSDGERAAYAYREGAFWGNVFSSSPAAYACDYVGDDAHSRSVNRYCAAGYPDGSGGLLSCGIITRVGSCDDHCQATGSGDFYPACGGDLTSQVITIYLQ
jgi:hypothetical protein